MILARDANNNWMIRKEVFLVIRKLASFDSKTAKNSYDYYICARTLSKLKRKERVVQAQSTTTKQSQVTIDQ